QCEDGQKKNVYADRDQQSLAAPWLKLEILVLCEQHFRHRNTSRSAMAALIRIANSRARRPSSPPAMGGRRSCTHLAKAASSNFRGSSLGGSSFRSDTRPIRSETIVPVWLA